ncbi:MAG: carboxypeptidase-like regulatory domain-containing protein [Flavobacteriaceae bacterium]
MIRWVYILITFGLFCLPLLSFGQNQFIQARVENQNTDMPMNNVHVLNLTQVIGTITDKDGKFELPAAVNDTLYFSYLGYKPLKVAVTQDLFTYNDTKFVLTELAYALEEVIVRPYQLTGYLDVDAKTAPVNPAGRYRIAGLASAGYEGGNRNRTAISKVIGALFNPADLLYNLFSKNARQFRKLKKMRADDEIKNLLSSKFDREVLVQLLGIDRFNLEEILRNCNYSDAFIKESNDLQILEAISECYDEYRILKL